MMNEPKKSLQDILQEIRAGGFAVGDRVRVTSNIDNRCGAVGTVVEILWYGSWPVIVDINGDVVGYCAEWLRKVKQ